MILQAPNGGPAWTVRHDPNSLFAPGTTMLQIFFQERDRLVSGIFTYIGAWPVYRVVQCLQNLFTDLIEIRPVGALPLHLFQQLHPPGLHLVFADEHFDRGLS